MSTPSAARLSSGRFAPGVSGNPNGRPKGARNRSSVLAEALRDGEAEMLVRALVELALAGDKPALRFCVARLVPPLKSRPIEFDLAEGAEADPHAVITASLRAVADGEITPDEAFALGRLVELRARVARSGHPVSDLYPRREREAAAPARPARDEARQESRGGSRRSRRDAAPSKASGGDPAAASRPVAPACISPVFAGVPVARAVLLSSCSARALAA
jgi:hypothetical protein